MARLLCVLAALASGASALRGTPPAATRRAICGAVASTLAAPLLSPAAARAAASGPDKKALQQVTDSAAALKKILKEKDAFAAYLNAGEFSLPVAISFPTFQKLEPAGLDMEAAVVRLPLSRLPPTTDMRRGARACCPRVWLGAGLRRGLSQRARLGQACETHPAAGGRHDQGARQAQGGDNQAVLGG